MRPADKRDIGASFNSPTLQEVHALIGVMTLHNQNGVDSSETKQGHCDRRIWLLRLSAIRWRSNVTVLDCYRETVSTRGHPCTELFHRRFDHRAAKAHELLRKISLAAVPRILLIIRLSPGLCMCGQQQVELGFGLSLHRSLT